MARTFQKSAIGNGARPTRVNRRKSGYARRRCEMSGQRLWGWARDRFGTPDRFFALLRDKLLSTLLSGRERRHSNVRQAAVERAPAALGGRSAAIDLQGRRSAG